MNGSALDPLCGRCFRPIQSNEGGFILSCSDFVCIKCINICPSRCPACGKEGVNSLNLKGNLPVEVKSSLADPAKEAKILTSTIQFQIKYYKTTMRRMLSRIVKLENENAQIKRTVQNLEGGESSQKFTQVVEEASIGEDKNVRPYMGQSRNQVMQTPARSTGSGRPQTSPTVVTASGDGRGRGRGGDNNWRVAADSTSDATSNGYSALGKRSGTSPSQQPQLKRVATAGATVTRSSPQQQQQQQQQSMDGTNGNGDDAFIDWGFRRPQSSSSNRNLGSNASAVVGGASSKQQQQGQKHQLQRQQQRQQQQQQQGQRSATGMHSMKLPRPTTATGTRQFHPQQRPYTTSTTVAPTAQSRPPTSSSTHSQYFKQPQPQQQHQLQSHLPRVGSSGGRVLAAGALLAAAPAGAAPAGSSSSSSSTGTSAAGAGGARLRSPYIPPIRGNSAGAQQQQQAINPLVGIGVAVSQHDRLAQQQQQQQLPGVALNSSALQEFLNQANIRIDFNHTN